ncbi:proline-rich protein HaeIII subfamily 1-like [Paramacrobiotus metropolitanus]|uniref:proline-rich protein HaeIII subfamily 1-like n=1 Tax=Paramacrobiotus metropolitanus TaxID=2943436 RepID=UPI00244574E2|nr:proline-rich protein HaeIII subfamily 1-like [Paramacrobiotus metropolitanus]
MDTCCYAVRFMMENVEQSDLAQYNWYNVNTVSSAAVLGSLDLDDIFDKDKGFTVQEPCFVLRSAPEPCVVMKCYATEMLMTEAHEDGKQKLKGKKYYIRRAKCDDEQDFEKKLAKYRGETRPVVQQAVQHVPQPSVGVGEPTASASAHPSAGPLAFPVPMPVEQPLPAPWPPVQHGNFAVPHAAQLDIRHPGPPPVRGQAPVGYQAVAPGVAEVRQPQMANQDMGVQQQEDIAFWQEKWETKRRMRTGHPEILQLPPPQLFGPLQFPPQFPPPWFPRPPQLPPPPFNGRPQLPQPGVAPAAGVVQPQAPPEDLPLQWPY